jgi:hypothetical protein
MSTSRAPTRHDQLCHRVDGVHHEVGLADGDDGHLGWEGTEARRLITALGLGEAVDQLGMECPEVGPGRSGLAG